MLDNSSFIITYNRIFELMKNVKSWFPQFYNDENLYYEILQGGQHNLDYCRQFTYNGLRKLFGND